MVSADIDKIKHKSKENITKTKYDFQKIWKRKYIVFKKRENKH